MTGPTSAHDAGSKVRRSQKEISRQLRKTKMCTYHLKGACPFADQCAFAHTFAELQVQPNLRKTRMCKFWMKGTCTDPSCNFAHGSEELNTTEHPHQALAGRQQRPPPPPAGKDWGKAPARAAHAKRAEAPAMGATPTPAKNMPMTLPPPSVPAVFDHHSTFLRNAPLPDPLAAMAAAAMTAPAPGLLHEDAAVGLLPASLKDAQLQLRAVHEAKLLQSELIQSTWTAVAASGALARPLAGPAGLVHPSVLAETEAKEQLAMGVQVLARTLRELTDRCNRISYELVRGADGGLPVAPALAFPPPGLEPAALSQRA